MPRLLAAWRAARRPSAPPPLARGPRRRGRFQPRGTTPGGRLPDGLLAPDELREVAAGVARLSRGLTRERELAGARYLDDERLLGAYLLFYWPVSYLQARGTISELPRRPRTVLEIGRASCRERV